MPRTCDVSHVRPGNDALNDWTTTTTNKLCSGFWFLWTILQTQSNKEICWSIPNSQHKPSVVSIGVQTPLLVRSFPWPRWNFTSLTVRSRGHLTNYLWLFRSPVNENEGMYIVYCIHRFRPVNLKSVRSCVPGGFRKEYMDLAGAINVRELRELSKITIVRNFLRSSTYIDLPRSRKSQFRLSFHFHHLV